MKKLLLSLVLAVSCNMSFGQNVTDFTFTGMLAKTTFAQFSLGSSNNTLELARKDGWISAIAAPTVDVSNITDMAFTMSGGYTVVTSPSPAGPIPTNYTNSVLPISGLVFTSFPFIYLKNTAGNRFRGVNIFIHKLVPAALPLIVANSQQATGFAHCGDVVNTAGGVPQLHTVGQAIYLAFTSAADVVNFQLENVGTAAAVTGALVKVEKSANLSTWSTIQDIDIANQPLSTTDVNAKQDYSLSINDASARYIRITVTGIASRSTRKENIRNISVTLPSSPGNNTLTGSGGTAWNTAANWSKGTLPGVNDDVIVAGGSSQIIVPTGTSINSLTINSGILGLGSSTTLNVNGAVNITGGRMNISGAFTAASINNAAEMNFNHSSTTNIAGNVSNTGTGVMTVNNHATNVSNLNITGALNNAGTTTVTTGGNLKVTGAINNTGTMTVDSGGNLRQDGTTNTNTGNIIVKRNSNALMRLDYGMWSSPVSSQTLEGFSPNTSRDPNQFWTYDAATNRFANVATTSNFSAGLGYLIRMPNDATTTPTAFAGQFTGIPNNGDITLSGLTADKFYSVGNPYPSTLNAYNATAANSFLTFNNQTTGTAYFWRKTNGAVGSAYATLTSVGGVASAAGSAVPSATIQVGQGFIVKTTGTSLTFSNTMRSTTNPTVPFFKTKNVTEKSCVWLNLTTTGGLFSQALVGYLDGATVGVDNGYDGLYINDSATALTSIVAGEEYTIQGRPAFDPTDVVALGFKTAAAGDFTIAIDSKDGVFAAAQDIYLVDSKTGIETDLKAGAYTFAADAGIDNARFSLKYQKTLKVVAPKFDENTVQVYKNNGIIVVNFATKTIKTIEVYDVQGRLVAKQKNVNASTATISNLKAVRQMLIVKVIADDNSVVSKKVLN